MDCSHHYHAHKWTVCICTTHINELCAFVPRNEWTVCNCRLAKVTEPRRPPSERTVANCPFILWCECTQSIYLVVQKQTNNLFAWYWCAESIHVGGTNANSLSNRLAKVTRNRGDRLQGDLMQIVHLFRGTNAHSLFMFVVKMHTVCLFSCYKCTQSLCVRDTDANSPFTLQPKR